MTKNTLIYLPFKLIEGVAGVVTLNRLTAMFSPDAYGGFVTANTAVNLAYLVLVAWLSNAAGRFIQDLDSSDKRQEHYSSTFAALATMILPCLLICLVLGLILPEHRLLCFLAGGMFASYSLFQLASIHLVRLGRVRAFSITSLLNALLKPTLAIALFNLTGNPENIAPALAAYIAADLSMGLIAVFLLRSPGFLSFGSISRERCLSYAKYGIPLIGTGIGLGLLNMSDRLLVGLFAGQAGLSVYSANYSIASVVFTLLMGGIMRGAYPPIIAGYSREGADGAVPLINRGVELYVMFALPAALGLAALSGRISSLLFVRAEYAAGNMIPGIVALAMFFWGLSEYSNKAFELEGNTKSILFCSLSAAGLNILLNLLTLRSFGFYAAAINTLLAFVFYFALSYTRAKKQFVFKLGLKIWATYIVSAVLCCISAFFVSSLIRSNLAAVLAGMAVGIAVYAALLILSGRLKAILGDLVK